MRWPMALNRAGSLPVKSAAHATVSRPGGWKRPMDLLLILLSLPFILPVVVLIAIYIKLVSPGPILFVQTRIGHQRKRFRCFKFRTMLAPARQTLHRKHITQAISDDAPMTKLDKIDPRIIPMGQILRASGMDELPQLLNVLRGEMSLIGPRPCTPYELRRYKPQQLERFEATPGITGLWQVSGKNATSFSEMIRFDIHYSRNASFGMDCKIIGLTAEVILKGVAEALRQRQQLGTASQDRKPVTTTSTTESGG